MKKRITTYTIALLLVASSIGNVQVFATKSVISPLTSELSANQHTEDISPYAEQLTYVYRINDDGVLQYRIWSTTEAKWLTEWTDVKTSLTRNMGQTSHTNQLKEPVKF